jgi:hypothetical protein
LLSLSRRLSVACLAASGDDRRGGMQQGKERYAIGSKDS